jgi:hypothetical protein
MAKNDHPNDAISFANQTAPAPESPARRPFAEPKLRFVEPKLTQRGDLAQVTAGFFGTFTPDT